MNLYSVIEKEKSTLSQSKFEEFLTDMIPILHEYESQPKNRAAILDKYKTTMNGEPSEPLDIDTCPNCGAMCRFIVCHKESDELCLDCGLVRAFQSEELSFQEEQDMQVTGVYSYKRINHFNEWLAQFQGQEGTTVPDSVIVTIREEIQKTRVDPSSITYAKMRQIMKKLSLGKYYENIPNITHKISGKIPPSISPDLEERFRLMFAEIQQPFERNCPPHRKNFLSYSFVLYKFCELLGQDHFLCHLPLLKSKDKLRECDKIWKAICSELRWEFIQTL